MRRMASEIIGRNAQCHCTIPPLHQTESAQVVSGATRLFHWVFQKTFLLHVILRMEQNVDFEVVANTGRWLKVRSAVLRWEFSQSRRLMTWKSKTDCESPSILWSALRGFSKRRSLPVTYGTVMEMPRVGCRVACRLGRWRCSPGDCFSASLILIFREVEARR